MTTKVISPKRLRELLYYDIETGAFTWIMKSAPKSHMKIGDVAGSINAAGYRVIVADGGRYLAHRLAWLYMTGEWPKEQIDHINLVRADTRWTNLREATQSQNNANKRAYTNSKSGIKGVFLDKQAGKWRAQIRANGKKYHLGYFDCPSSAHAAYVAVAEKLFGKFVRLS